VVPGLPHALDGAGERGRREGEGAGHERSGPLLGFHFDGFRWRRGFKDRGTMRQQRDAEGYTLAPTCANDTLQIALVYIGWAAGHCFPFLPNQAALVPEPD